MAELDIKGIKPVPLTARSGENKVDGIKAGVYIFDSKNPSGEIKLDELIISKFLGATENIYSRTSNMVDIAKLEETKQDINERNKRADTEKEDFEGRISRNSHELHKNRVEERIAKLEEKLAAAKTELEALKKPVEIKPAEQEKELEEDGGGTRKTVPDLPPLSEEDIKNELMKTLTNPKPARDYPILHSEQGSEHHQRSLEKKIAKIEARLETAKAELESIKKAEELANKHREENDARIAEIKAEADARHQKILNNRYNEKNDKSEGERVGVGFLSVLKSLIEEALEKFLSGNTTTVDKTNPEAKSAPNTTSEPIPEPILAPTPEPAPEPKPDTEP